MLSGGNRAGTSRARQDEIRESFQGLSCIFGLAVLATSHGLNGSDPRSPVTRPWGLAETPLQRFPVFRIRGRALLSSTVRAAVWLVRHGRGALRVGQAQPGLQSRRGRARRAIVDLPQGDTVLSSTSCLFLVILGIFSGAVIIN